MRESVPSKRFKGQIFEFAIRFGPSLVLMLFAAFLGVNRKPQVLYKGNQYLPPWGVEIVSREPMLVSRFVELLRSIVTEPFKEPVE